MNKRISVALCTYNGAQYVEEQLESIARQSRLPDELVICDDVSKDETVRIVERLAPKLPFNVHVVVNARNLGTSKNFEQAVTRCSGDLIALADQDDVWAPWKLACLEQAFAGDPTVGCAFSNAEVTDKHLGSLGYDVWDVAGFSESEREDVNAGRAFRIMLRHNVVTGATMAFRAVLRKWLLPIPDVWGHDEWIAMLLSATQRLVAIDKPLIKYRQHEQNQIGASAKSLVMRAQLSQLRDLRGEAAKLATLVERLVACGCMATNPDYVEEVKKKILHLERRRTFRNGFVRGLVPALSELIFVGYHKYSNGTKSFLSDAFSRELHDG